MKIRRFKINTIQVLSVLTLSFLPGINTFAHNNVEEETHVQERQAVSLETLLKVKSRIESLQLYVESRIVALGIPTPQDNDPEPRYCRDYRSFRECSTDQNCQWNGSPNDGYCTSLLRSLDENDSLAGVALLYLSSELVELGEIIDQAIFAYPDPLYLSYISQACLKANTIRNQAQAAKFSARLPPIGLISEAEFNPIIEEMNAVRADLNCF
ncbi:MAG: hypothetical protein ACOH5I_16065 [Oligoflexus sp.]